MLHACTCTAESCAVATTPSPALTISQLSSRNREPSETYTHAWWPYPDELLRFAEPCRNSVTLVTTDAAEREAFVAVDVLIAGVSSLTMSTSSRLSTPTISIPRGMVNDPSYVPLPKQTTSPGEVALRTRCSALACMTPPSHSTRITRLPATRAIPRVCKRSL